MVRALTVLTALTVWSGSAAAEVVDTPTQYLIPKATQPIQVDGKLGEWDMAGTVYTMSADGKNPMNRVWQNGRTNPVKGDGDLSGRAALAWDAQCLYIAGQMQDDQMRGIPRDSAGNQGPAPWGCDSLMIAIASFRQPMKPNKPTFETPLLGLRYAPQGPDARGELVAVRSKAQLLQRDMFWKLPPGSRWAVRETPIGYNVEAAIPWKALAFVPRAGERLFVAFMAVDIDPDEALNQIGWGYTGKPKHNPVFRLAEGDDVLGILTASVDEVPAGEAWSVRAELDALKGTAKLDAVRVVDAGGRQVLGKPVGLSVPAGKTGTVLVEFEANAVKTGAYMVEAVARAAGGKPTVVARVPVQIVKPKAEAVSVQPGPALIGNMNPDRVAVNAFQEHRLGYYRHGFVKGKADYVPYIRKWIEPGLKARAAALIKTKSSYSYSLALHCVAVHQITGDDEYARLARDLTAVVLETNIKELQFHVFYELALYRNLTWQRDPKTPYAPADAEESYRRALCNVAAKPAEVYLGPWGDNNHAWHRYSILKPAQLVAEADKQPIDPRVIEYVDFHDALYAKSGDSTDASAHYHWTYFRSPLAVYLHTDDWKTFLAQKGLLAALRRYRQMASPSGACPQFGDTNGWPTTQYSIWAYELLSRVSRDGRYRWVAHRIAEYMYNHLYERADQYHTTFRIVQQGFVAGYLLADDTVVPVAPPATSRVTWRHPTVPIPLEDRKKRHGLGEYRLDLTRWIPDKLVLSSGNGPQGLWGLVDLLPFGGHTGEMPGDFIALMAHDAALLAGQGYNDHYPKSANILWIEDLDGVAADPRPARVTVPIFVDDPAFTFVRIRSEGYQHLPVVYTRDIVFVKNGFVLVKDRATFSKAMKVRLGPGFQTRRVGPQMGTNWFNTYYDKMYHTGLGLGLGVQSMRNPAWDLLVYYSPRPGRMQTVTNRFEENPYRCSPIRTRQSWSGMTRAGQELTFTTVLLPHAPIFKPAELLDPPADSKDPKRIEIAAEGDNLTVVKVVSGMNPDGRHRTETWLMLNDTGKLAEAGPLAADGIVSIISRNAKGAVLHRVVVGGKTLRYRDTDESGKARKLPAGPLTVPKSLGD